MQNVDDFYVFLMTIFFSDSTYIRIHTLKYFFICIASTIATFIW